MAVAQEVKFNRFGVPYVMEFSNVSFRENKEVPRRSQTAPMPALARADSTASRASASSQSPPRAPTLRSYTRSPVGRRRNTVTRSPSPPSEPLTSWCTIPSFSPPPPAPAPAPRLDVTKPGKGLYIQFTPYVPSPDAPPPYEVRPRPVTSRSAVLRLRRAIAAAVQESGMESPNAEKTDPLEEADSPGGRAAKSTKSLFRGTYGQVMSALKEAGLMTTPCPEDGVEK
ncbi:hypothetical protein HWV62_40950, partial [Athelia sp. TMB]